MKKYIILAVLLFLPFLCFPQDSYDVIEIYQGISPTDSDTKVLTSGGDIEDVEYILVPMKLEAGTYELEITKKASNLYKVVRKDIFIQTRFCYEYANYDNVILKYESDYGYTRGKLIFNY